MTTSSRFRSGVFLVRLPEINNPPAIGPIPQTGRKPPPLVRARNPNPTMFPSGQGANRAAGSGQNGAAQDRRWFLKSVPAKGCVVIREVNLPSPKKRRATQCTRPLFLSLHPKESMPIQRSIGEGLRACPKIARGPAARDFGCGQGGEVRASPTRAVRTEPTQATDKRPAARRVFAPKAAWLRCSSVEDPGRIFSFVAPRHPAFGAKTGPRGIFGHALRAGAMPRFDL